MEKEKNCITFDLRRLTKCFRKKLVVLLLAAVIGAGVGAVCARFLIAPSYCADVCFYVNNGSARSDAPISASDITASRELVETCQAFLQTRTVLEAVISQAQIDRTADALAKQIETEQIGNSELLRVTVSAPDPAEATKIADCVARILPDYMKASLPNAALSVISTASVDSEQVASDVGRYALFGSFAGALAMGAWLSLRSFGQASRTQDN